MLLNNICVFLNNACGSDCPTTVGEHLCENCYKITHFCEDCESHLENVINMSNCIWVAVILIGVFCAGMGYLFGSLERSCYIKNRD